MPQHLLLCLPQQLPTSSQQSVVSPMVTNSHFKLEFSEHIYVQIRLLHASTALIMDHNSVL